MTIEENPIIKPEVECEPTDNQIDLEGHISKILGAGAVMFGLMGLHAAFHDGAGYRLGGLAFAALGGFTAKAALDTHNQSQGEE